MATRTPNTPKRRKRKRKGRLRKGRISVVLFILILIIAGIVWLCRCCGDNLIDSPSVPITEAAEAGRRDAAIAVSAPEGTMARQNALLRIHARHSELMHNGFKQAADEYLNAADNYLNTHTYSK
ncbi:MAG: hypothetical protein ACI31C_08055 [Muribaculaceae bacterium]